MVIFYCGNLYPAKVLKVSLFNQPHTWFLEIGFDREVSQCLLSMYACVRVHVSAPRLLKTIHMK